jgi:hypothetical protein
MLASGRRNIVLPISHEVEEATFDAMKRPSAIEVAFSGASDIARCIKRIEAHATRRQRQPIAYRPVGLNGFANAGGGLFLMSAFLRMLGTSPSRCAFLRVSFRARRSASERRSFISRKMPFALHLFLQDSKSLVDVVVANEASPSKSVE